MNKGYILLLLFLLIAFNSFSQAKYSLKAEAGFTKFLFNPVSVDAGPDWKGYYLDGQNGIDINISNGVMFKKKIYTGLGFGYLNFEGQHGVSIFSDFEFLSVKKKIAPLANIKIGYFQLWNQYENGTDTVLIELMAGLNYHLTESVDIYFKSGFLITQQSLLIPIRLGFRF